MHIKAHAYPLKIRKSMCLRKPRLISSENHYKLLKYTKVPVCNTPYCWTHRIFVILQKQAAMTKMEAMLNQMDIWEEIAMINVWKPQNKYSQKHLKALTVMDGARCLQGSRTRFRNHTFHSGNPLIIGIYHVASTRRQGDIFSCVLHTIYIYVYTYIYIYTCIWVYNVEGTVRNCRTFRGRCP